MRKNNILSIIMLLCAAMIWGFAFVAQDRASSYVEPFTLNGVRSLIGSVSLIPVIFVMSKKSSRPILEKTKKDRKTLIVASLICGFALCISTNIQQFGIAMYPDTAATSGRSGFLTAMYVIFVPILGLFLKKRAGFTVIIGVLLSIVGLYLLCFANGIKNIYAGDIVMLSCAVAFSIQILCIDYFKDSVDGVKLSCLQFFVCGVLSIVFMFIFEKPSFGAILSQYKELLFLGVFSSGIAYTLQIIGQQYSSNPTVSSIVMSMESVFAAFGGALIMNERLTIRELIGCFIMLLAIIVAQLPSSRFKKSVHNINH